MALGQGNIALHTREWLALGKPLPMLVQGDARCLRQIITDASCVVSSPPYANSVDSHTCGIDWSKMGPATGKRKRGPGTKHYETQVAQMSYQPACVVSSPPYAHSDTKPTALGLGHPTRADGDGAGRNKGDYAYPASSGQLGSMPSGNLDEVLKCINPCITVAPNAEAKNTAWQSNVADAITPSLLEPSTGPMRDASKRATCMRESNIINGQEETKTIEDKGGQELVTPSNLNVAMSVSDAKHQIVLKSITSNQERKLEESGTIANQISLFSVERAITSGTTTKGMEQITSRPIRPPTISILKNLKASQPTLDEQKTVRETSVITQKISSHRENKQGSLAAVIVTSPPWEDARQDTTNSRKGHSAPTQHDPESWQPQTILTSPPYEAAASNCATNHGKEGKSHWKAGGIAAREGLEGYGDTNGQVGNLSHQSYWSEIAKIYAACYDVLPVGGHIILVLKSFVRRGAIVDLPMQTAQLLEHVGFKVLHYHHAMLSSPVGQSRLFDDGEDRTSRKSFFRRLCEQKGAPVIDHEAVLCAEKA